jgi:hypothetical protein
MISLFLAIAYCCVLFLCQIFNGATLFPGVLIIPVGLFIHNTVPYLSSLQATILYCLIGSILDVIFPFLPFGISIIFCTFFYCTQKAVFSPRYSILPSYRIAFEQFANVLYILLLCIFRNVPFSLFHFLPTVILSQICIFLVSNKMAIFHKRLMAIYDNYMKYQK